MGDLYPPHQRSRMLALFMLGVPVGRALNYFLTGPIAQAWGWRTATVVAALPVLILTPALAMLAEPERGVMETVRQKGGEVSVLKLLRILTLWWIIASGVFVNFNMYAIGVFLPPLLSWVHKMTLAESGWDGDFESCGRGLRGLLAGYLGDRIGHKSRHGWLLLAAELTSLREPLAYISIIQPVGSVGLALTMLMRAYGTMNTYYGFAYTSIQDLVVPTQRGLTMAIYFLEMYLCGASFGPLITGMANDRMARKAIEEAGATQMTEASKAVGLQQAMKKFLILLVALGAVLFAASPTIAEDV